MSKALQLFTASFWLLVRFPSGAGQISCALSELAPPAYGGATASVACAGPAWPAHDGAMVSHVLKGAMRHAFSGATACSVCEGPVLTVLAGATVRAARWAGPGSVLNGRATASFKKRPPPGALGRGTDTPSAIEKASAGGERRRPDLDHSVGTDQPSSITPGKNGRCRLS